MHKRQEKQISRRRLLSHAGIGAAGLSFPMASIVSGESNEAAAKASFDPSDKKEASKFLKELNEEDQEVQERAFNNLSPKQKETAQELLKIDEITVATMVSENPEEPSEIGSRGYNGYTKKEVNRHVNGKNSIGDTILRFYQDLTYEWWYEQDVRIVDVSTHASTYMTGWKYREEDSRNKTDFGTYADSFTKGKFELCVSGVCGQSAYPYLELRCFSKAGWRYERTGW